MRFDVITIFPGMLDFYLNESMLKRARDKGFIDIQVHNLREATTDLHNTVDDTPYGGGPGMVMKVEPIVKTVSAITRAKKTKVMLFAPGGKQFDATMARRLAKMDQLILICGRYEGIDARVKKILKAEEISVGPYVLTGAELPAMTVIDAVARHIPGVLGKNESLEEERYGVGVPAYTRPEVVEWQGKKYKVPKVLLSGDHKKIEDWRRNKSK